MTYTESKKQTPFDWNAFLNKKTRTEEEWVEAAILADDWVTCACGNLCDSIPRLSFSGCPVDNTLRNFGSDFYDWITLKDLKNAKITLDKIEVRSAQLISEINER